MNSNHWSNYSRKSKLHTQDKIKYRTIGKLLENQRAVRHLHHLRQLQRQTAEVAVAILLLWLMEIMTILKFWN